MSVNDVVVRGADRDGAAVAVDAVGDRRARRRSTPVQLSWIEVGDGLVPVGVPGTVGGVVSGAATSSPGA